MTEIVCYLTGASNLDGKWIVVRECPPTFFVGCWPREGYTTVYTVATGCVEWDGNRCAEVYVPRDRLAEWRAEFDVA